MEGKRGQRGNGGRDGEETTQPLLFLHVIVVSCVTSGFARPHVSRPEDRWAGFSRCSAEQCGVSCCLMFESFNLPSGNGPDRTGLDESGRKEGHVISVLLCFSALCCSFQVHTFLFF